MKKPIIFAVVAFVVALAASTFLGMQKLKKANAAAALAAAAHADSLTAKHTADSLASHDSTKAEGEHGEEHAEAPKDTAGGHEAAPAATPAAAHGEPSPTSGPKPATLVSMEMRLPVLPNWPIDELPAVVID